MTHHADGFDCAFCGMFLTRPQMKGAEDVPLVTVPTDDEHSKYQYLGIGAIYPNYHIADE